MIKNSFQISQEEKERIKSLHENAKKINGTSLSEQMTPGNQQQGKTSENPEQTKKSAVMTKVTNFFPTVWEWNIDTENGKKFNSVIVELKKFIPSQVKTNNELTFDAVAKTLGIKDVNKMTEVESQKLRDYISASLNYNQMYGKAFYSAMVNLINSLSKSFATGQVNKLYPDIQKLGFVDELINHSAELLTKEGLTISY